MAHPYAAALSQALGLALSLPPPQARQHPTTPVGRRFWKSTVLLTYAHRLSSPPRASAAEAAVASLSVNALVLVETKVGGASAFFFRVNASRPKATHSSTAITTETTMMSTISAPAGGDMGGETAGGGDRGGDVGAGGGDGGGEAGGDGGGGDGGSGGDGGGGATIRVARVGWEKDWTVVPRREVSELAVASAR